MRCEYKYIVPVERLDAIREDILRFATLDGYASREKHHHYTVRSIYFDTPRFDAYREKIEGIKIRKKLRIRSYNQWDTDRIAFLEIKSKMDRRGMKHRAPIRFEDLPAFLQAKEVEEFVLPGATLSRSLDNARRFLFHYVRSSMRPVILVAYEREAYQGCFDATLRITLDKHLRFSPFPTVTELFQEQTLRHVAPRYFILEIKFGNGFAQWLQAIVRKHSLVRTSISKYGACIDASKEIRPLLPRRSMDTQSQELLWRGEAVV
jgi:hypothetical protein